MELNLVGMFFAVRNSDGEASCTVQAILAVILLILTSVAQICIYWEQQHHVRAHLPILQHNHLGGRSQLLAWQTTIWLREVATSRQHSWLPEFDWLLSDHGDIRREIPSELLCSDLPEENGAAVMLRSERSKVAHGNRTGIPSKLAPCSDAPEENGAAVMLTCHISERLKVALAVRAKIEEQLSDIRSRVLDTKTYSIFDSSVQRSVPENVEGTECALMLNYSQEDAIVPIMLVLDASIISKSSGADVWLQ